MHAESFNDGQRLQHVSYASQLLVPGEDVAVIRRVVVAFAMEHDAVTRRKESVTILKCADVNRRLFGKRDSSMTGVYLVDGACRCAGHQRGVQGVSMSGFLLSCIAGADLRMEGSRGPSIGKRLDHSHQERL